MTATHSDHLNRSTWTSEAALREVRSWAGFTDPGEKAALEAIADEVRGQPILDLGVGAGRTVPLLRGLSEEYTALDYLPEMVELCSRAHPGVRVIHGDARDLSQFASGSFKLVSFSFNGLDAVEHGDRQRILAEVFRVLRPGGIFFFSTFNQEGPSYDEKPWVPRVDFSHPVRMVRSGLRWLGSLPVELNNWRARRHLNVRGPDWSLMLGVAHHYGLLIHFTTLAEERRELERVGFAPDPTVFECRQGQRVLPGADVSRSWWFHLLARKPV